MSNILLPLQAGTWPVGYCPTTYQEWLQTAADNLKAVLENGRAFYNLGDTKPAPEFQAYPWLRTTDGRWYVYSGVWRAPTNYSLFERRLFVGTLTDLETYDGGSAGISGSPTSGPMWEEDEDYRGRSPMGPGDIVDTSPVKTLVVNEQWGSGVHTLTAAEGANAEHTHGIGVADLTSDDAYLPVGGTSTVPTWQSQYVTGGGTPDHTQQTTANLFTLKSGADGLGVPDPTPFNIVHPVVGCYVVKWTGRLYFTVP